MLSAKDVLCYDPGKHRDVNNDTSIGIAVCGLTRFEPCVLDKGWADKVYHLYETGLENEMWTCTQR